MNERRMREPFNTLIWKASIGYNDSWSQVDPEVLEKFAELIVRKCAELSRSHQDFPETEQTIRRWVAEDIERHFGVV